MPKIRIPFGTLCISEAKLWNATMFAPLHTPNKSSRLSVTRGCRCFAGTWKSRKTSRGTSSPPPRMLSLSVVEGFHSFPAREWQLSEAFRRMKLLSLCPHLQSLEREETLQAVWCDHNERLPELTCMPTAHPTNITGWHKKLPDAEYNST